MYSPLHLLVTAEYFSGLYQSNGFAGKKVKLFFSCVIFIPHPTELTFPGGHELFALASRLSGNVYLDCVNHSRN